MKDTFTAGVFLSFLVSLCASAQSLDFSIADTICLNDSVTIQNLSSGYDNYYWTFCNQSLSNDPTADSLGLFNGTYEVNAFTDLAVDRDSFYSFTTNYNAGELVRASFGNSFLNTPTAEAVVSGLGASLEGLEITRHGNYWIIFTVSDYNGLSRIEFGNSLANSSPVVTSLGNIGSFSYPHDMQMVKDGNNWYGFVANRNSNSITKLSFDTGLLNTPSGVNYSFPDNLDEPSGVFIEKKSGY